MRWNGRRQRRRGKVILIAIVTLLMFLYLVYALLNPEKF
ncbi:K(+)-transporting ATPase subunit F [Paenibacillus sp. NPDC058174]